MYISVEQNDSINFVSPQFIYSELKEADFKVKGELLDSVQIDSIENYFKGKDYIEDARCYFIDNNAVRLDITPIRPFIRLLSGNQFYYVNKKGKRVKADAQYFINLPIVKYDGKKEFKLTSLIPMLDHIEKNDFLRELVTMVEVADSNNIYLIPCIAGHKINMGSLENYESKFKKLQRFYNEVLQVKGWNAYETINLKWDHQIVAKRRNARSRLKIETYDPTTEEMGDDSETMGDNQGETEINETETKKQN